MINLDVYFGDDQFWQKAKLREKLGRSKATQRQLPSGCMLYEFPKLTTPFIQQRRVVALSEFGTQLSAVPFIEK